MNGFSSLPRGPWLIPPLLIVATSLHIQSLSPQPLLVISSFHHHASSFSPLFPLHVVHVPFPPPSLPSPAFPHPHPSSLPPLAGLLPCPPPHPVGSLFFPLSPNTCPYLCHSASLSPSTPFFICCSPHHLAATSICSLLYPSSHPQGLSPQRTTRPLW